MVGIVLLRVDMSMIAPYTVTKYVPDKFVSVTSAVWLEHEDSSDDRDIAVIECVCYHRRWRTT